MKKTINDLVSAKVEFSKLEARMDASTDAVEVRELGKTLASLKDEIAAIEKELADKDAEKPAENVPAEAEARSKMDVMKAYNVGNAEIDSRGTMEYRSAYKDYVQTGAIADVLQFRNNQTGKVIEARAAGPLTSADLGVLLPTTIVQEVIKDLEKSYGQLYSKVRKFNVKGGIKIPTASFGATFKRIGETGAPTERQKAGEVTGYVEFSYKLGEVRISQTLLESVLSVEVFEREVAKVIVEAYMKAMEDEILNGEGSANQCEGILTNTDKIPAENIIEFTDDEMKDWTKVQKKLFAKVPLAMRREKLEFAMTVNTYEGNLKVLADDNNRPLAKEVYNPVDNVETATFNNKEVVFIEEGLGIKNFDEAGNGEYFGIYWAPQKAYGINSNMEFATKRYFDEEKLEWVTRAVVINDGKILDGKYIFLLKKKVTA